LWEVGVGLGWGLAGVLLYVWCSLGRIGGRAALVVRRLLLLSDVRQLGVWLLSCVWRRIGTGVGWLSCGLIGLVGGLIELEGGLVRRRVGTGVGWLRCGLIWLVGGLIELEGGLVRRPVLS
jgi:hypothetical protein